MGFKRRFSALALAVSMAILFGGSAYFNAYAEGEHAGQQKQFSQRDLPGHDRHGMHGEFQGHHGWELFKGLNLTAPQKEQMKGVMKGHHKEFIEGRIAMLQARQNLMIATTGRSFDQAAVQKAAGDVSAAQERMSVLHAKVFSEVMPILTPDQQVVVQGKLAQAKLRTQKAISKLESKLNSKVE